MIQYIKRHLWAALLLSLLLLGGFWGAHIWLWSIPEQLLWSDFVIPPLCVLGVGFVLSYLTERYALLPERSYWVLVCYVMLVCSFPNTFERSAAFPAALLVTLSLPALMHSATDADTRKGPFLVSFFITCAWFLYFPSAFIIIPFIISLLRLAKASFKDMTAFLGGLITPLLMVLSFKWLRGEDIPSYLQMRWEELLDWSPAFHLHQGSLTQTLLICVLGGILVIALLTRLLSKENTTLVVARFYEMLLLMLVTSAVVMGCYADYSHSFLPILCIPMALLTTSFFSQKKGVVPKLFFALLVAVLVLHFVNSKLQLL